MNSLLTLLDDIAATFDDVAVMTKVAMKNTSALMTDDLAVNAGVVTGVNANRELPMVKAIFLGSLLNKVYAITGVLVVLAIYPPFLNIVLLVGGLYLSYEGAHKVFEKVFKKGKKAERNPATEEERVKGAIRTDFILSLEIIVIANSSAQGSFLEQALTLVSVGIAASVLIYGLVAVLVKVDDFGLHLVSKGYQKIGEVLVRSMPYAMKGLGILGTAAMFLVGGGIIAHIFHIPYLLNEHIQNLVFGLVAGFVSLGGLSLAAKAFKK